jgi:hypothetical protein
MLPLLAVLPRVQHGIATCIEHKARSGQGDRVPHLPARSPPLLYSSIFRLFAGKAKYLKKCDLKVKKTQIVKT